MFCPKHIRLLLVIAGLTGFLIVMVSDKGVASRTVQAFSSGPLPGNTGAPGEQTCSSCHSGSGGLADGTFTILNVPQTYRPGYTYEIGIRHSATDPTRKRWGFQLTALTADNQKAGDLQVEDGGISQVLTNVGPGGNRQYIEHNLGGTFNGRTGGAVWYFFWQAPSQNVGPVTFYAAGNQANGDFDSTGDDIFTARAVAQPPTNPIDDVTFFVTQQYLDFLGRAPDPGGLAFWSSQIAACQSSVDCIQQQRAEVATAFFLSQEFQQTAFFDNRLYQVAYGRPPTYPEFVSDMSLLRLGSGGDLIGNRTAFLEGFTQSANFKNLYAVLQNSAYVDALVAIAGLSITASERGALITGLNNGAETRGSILGKLTDNGAFQQATFNAGFVRLAYFCYLQRATDDAGYQFWLDSLNQHGGNIIDIVKAFILSDEYRRRFGPNAATRFERSSKSAPTT